MRKKQIFETPAVMKTVDLRMENPILAASVMDYTSVTANGQDVHDLNFSQSTFNHNWDEN